MTLYDIRYSGIAIATVKIRDSVKASKVKIILELYRYELKRECGILKIHPKSTFGLRRGSIQRFCTCSANIG